MKSVAAVVFAGLLSPAFAQDAPPKIDPPPPPAMNAPGVKASELVAPAASVPQAPADNPMTRRPPPLPQVGGLPPGPSPATTPQVSVRRQDGNTIEEYREGGRVYMIVVTPPNGIRQTYMVDQAGKLRGPSDAPVNPVMYTILEWGKSKPPADTDDDAPAAAASTSH